MQIREYLEENQKGKRLDDSHSNRKLLNDIVENPLLIGLPTNTEFFREVSCVTWNKSFEVDLVGLSEENVFVIESKSSKSPKSLPRMKSQLEKQYWFFKEKFNVTPICIGVYKSGGKKVIYGIFEFEEYKTLSESEEPYRD